MNATDKAKEVFTRFKELYPNNVEEFVPTLDNLQRWHWSVTEAERRNSGEYNPFEIPDQTKAKELAASRAFRVFDKMPEYMKTKFMELASRYPGRKVWATGSRVNGDFIDEYSGPKIARMREQLFKKSTGSSDYDIIVELLPGEKVADLRKVLPQWGDLIVNPDPEQIKILIPMWDFSKLPEELHPKVIELVRGKRWPDLMVIHNEYQLSTNFYCCEVDAVRRWFTWAVEQRIINEDSQTNP